MIEEKLIKLWFNHPQAHHVYCQRDEDGFETTYLEAYKTTPKVKMPLFYQSQIEAEIAQLYRQQEFLNDL